MADFTPGKTGSSRVFLIEGRARPDHQPAFQACMMAGALEQNFGDTERIECPDPAAYGQYIEVGEIQGASERPTLPLTSKFAADLASKLAELAKKRCPFDIQVHFGACTDPRVFNTFTKSIIIEKGKGGSYSTDDLGSLASGDEAEINETLETSGAEFFEVLKLSAQEVGGDAVTNPLNDVIFCSIVSCGDCEDQDGGCNKIFAVGESTPGSPGTAPDLVYSLNGGSVWYAAEISTLTPGDGADGVACLGDYVVIVSEDEGALHYFAKGDLDATPPAGSDQITTGFVATHDPTDIWSVGNYAFISAELGYVYGTDDATAGVTVLDAGVATTQTLEAVHAISDQIAVAVGAANAVVHTTNKTTWSAITGPSVGNILNCVWLKSETEWWVGTSAGELFYTLDGGTNWTQKNLPGQANITSVNDVAFANDSVGYVAVTLVDGTGTIKRTYDGGYSWVTMPDAGGVFPDNDTIAAVAACVNDPNIVAGVGTGGNATDGIIVVAQD